MQPAALPLGHNQSQHAGPPHCLDPSPLLTKTQTVCFSLTGHKYHHCCPPPFPLNGSSTLFATIYDLFQGPVTGAKEGGGSGKGAPTTPPPRKPIFPHPCAGTMWDGGGTIYLPTKGTVSIVQRHIPSRLAHARPCLSIGWALNCRFEEILGPLFLWSRMEDWVSVERL